MQDGYLIVSTNSARPGLVRLRGELDNPFPSAGGPGGLPERGPGDLIVYVARFRDLEAALMHFHTGLSRRLVDVNRRLYKAAAADAVAVAQCIELPHRPIFIDPDVAQSPQLEAATARIRRRHRVVRRIFDVVGILALVALVASSLLKP